MSWFKSKNPEKHKVEILFKSGTSIVVSVDSFAVTKNTNNKVHSLEWKNMKPALMFIDLSEIAAIIEL